MSTKEELIKYYLSYLPGLIPPWSDDPAAGWTTEEIRHLKPLIFTTYYCTEYIYIHIYCLLLLLYLLVIFIIVSIIFFGFIIIFIIVFIITIIFYIFVIYYIYTYIIFLFNRGREREKYIPQQCDTHDYSRLIWYPFPFAECTV